jgi:hypothetical protein
MCVRERERGTSLGENKGQHKTTNSFFIPRLVSRDADFRSLQTQPLVPYRRRRLVLCAFRSCYPFARVRVCALIHFTNFFVSNKEPPLLGKKEVLLIVVKRF